MTEINNNINMFCKTCGKNIDNDSRFCIFCGTEHIISKTTNELKIEDEKVYNSDEIQIKHKPDIVKNSLKNSENINNQPIFDITYQKETGAVIIGIVGIVGLYLINAFQPKNDGSYDYYETSKNYSIFVLFIFLIFRIISAMWINKISKRQNRDPTPPTVLGIFFPSITLIAVGLKKKKYAFAKVYENISNEKNSSLLSRQAQDFYSNQMNEEAHRFSLKAVELDPNNKLALSIIEKINLQNQNKERNINKIEQLEFITSEGLIIKGEILNDNYEGTEVLINGEIPTNGEYFSDDKKEKLLIEFGKIKERLFINKESKYIYEQKNKHTNSVGDYIFSLKGEKLKTGIYKNGFMASRIIVEDGKIKGFK